MKYLSTFPTSRKQKTRTSYPINELYTATTQENEQMKCLENLQAIYLNKTHCRGGNRLLSAGPFAKIKPLRIFWIPFTGQQRKWILGSFRTLRVLYKKRVEFVFTAWKRGCGPTSITRCNRTHIKYSVFLPSHRKAELIFHKIFIYFIVLLGIPETETKISDSNLTHFWKRRNFVLCQSAAN